MLSDLFVHLPLQRTYFAVALNKVSRSFALVIPWLEEPLQEEMAAAYLLCRTLDNIEDCGHPLAWQKARFAEFIQSLAEPSQAPAMLHQWQSFAWPGLTPDEASLMTMDDGLPLWLIYAGFPEDVRATCYHWMSLMAAGMESMLDHEQSTGMLCYNDIRLPATVGGYNDYCYHVAGTVGGMGTDLVIAHYGLGRSVAERLLVQSSACGRALQKTNILKDFVEDLERRVCYLPDEWLRQIGYMPLQLSGAPLAWSQAVIQDVLGELRDATEYVQSIPVEAKGYRIASLVCLLPAYQTILSAAQRLSSLFTIDHQIKIARETMARCLHEAVTLAPDNDAIRNHCGQLEQAICAHFEAEPVRS
jgi:farnesyl-diphosphate farnesyltransferase